MQKNKNTVNTTSMMAIAFNLESNSSLCKKSTNQGHYKEKGVGSAGKSVGYSWKPPMLG